MILAFAFEVHIIEFKLEKGEEEDGMTVMDNLKSQEIHYSKK